MALAYIYYILSITTTDGGEEAAYVLPGQHPSRLQL